MRYIDYDDLDQDDVKEFAKFPKIVPPRLGVLMLLLLALVFGIVSWFNL